MATVPADLAGLRLGHIVLGDELAKVRAALAADLPEAAALYAARILEAGAATVMGRLGLDPSSSSFSNLETLWDYGALGGIRVRYCAHSLRRIGNDARHLLRPVGPAHGAVAATLMDVVVDWLAAAHGLHAPPAAAGDSAIAQASTAPDLPDADLAAFADALDADRPAGAWDTGVPACLVAEIAIQRGTPATMAAGARLLAAAAARFPDDLRVRQLQALLHKRQGDLDAAQRVLPPPDDEEGMGLTASISKARWQADPTRLKDLRNAFTWYERGWERSRKRTCWLGINAAATAAFLGDRARAAALATTVRDLLVKRQDTLARANGPFAFTWWDQATLAEALLITGDTDASDAAYALCATSGNRAGDWAVAQKQRAALRQALHPAPA